MKPEEIFTLRGYDMVVAVTFDAINRQLEALGRSPQGLTETSRRSPFEVVIEMGIGADDNWEPRVRTDFTQVQKDPVTGIPFNETLFGTYRPRMGALRTGREVSLIVEFTSGSLWTRSLASGNMRPAIDITGWSFQMPVNVNFEKLERNSPRPFVTDVVEKRLNRFHSSDFAISRVFADFQSVDLLEVSSTINVPDGTNRREKQLFQAFMLNDDGFLAYLQKHPGENPYTLGFSAAPPTEEELAQDDKVPNSLRPVGNTFNVFYDSSDPSRSTLNFILNTKDSAIPPGTHPTADTFDSNWLSSTDTADGKMTYSFRACLETLILKEFYNQYAAGIHQQVSEGGVSIFEPVRDYEKAKQANGAGRYLFNISNQDSSVSNDDRYTNSFEATWRSTASGITVDLSGQIHWYKEKSRNVVILTQSQEARAWAGCTTTWKGHIDVTLSQEDGKQVLHMSDPALAIESTTPISDRNGVAKSLSSWGNFLDDILGVGKVFFLFTQNQWLGAGIFGLALVKFPSKIKVNGVTLELALRNLPSMASNTVFLAAGSVFQYKNVQVDGLHGTTSMLIDFKPEVLQN
ncbi:hypothetical protein BKA63DRAFT_553355 [Paraphoma chrysanthemicola]|nr:hypothetical protein BKA63DRAFT_553355 [Paraphoma chrysanthemicola]